MYDFDTVIDRHGTGCIKYDRMLQEKGRTDLLPLWVADMDLRAPQEVLDALHERVDHGIFGYTAETDAYRSAVCRWFEMRHGWRPDGSWILTSPGVVSALFHTVQAFTRPGDPVLIMQPVYYPFADAVRESGRRLVNSELLYRDGRYEMDFSDIERKIRENDIRLCLFCSPQNPTGRVWTKEELRAFSDICVRHGVLVVSDEIHCDFVYPGHEHTIYASLSEAARENCVICTAPSKTFNLAGLQTSNLFIPGRKLRTALRKQLLRSGLFGANALGLTACRAAYENGGPWLEELKAYLYENLQCLRDGLAEAGGRIRIVEPDGLYLVWLDCSGLGMEQRDLERFILNEAKLWLDEGSLFGGNSGLFMRINIACPRVILREGIGRLQEALARRQA